MSFRKKPSPLFRPQSAAAVGRSTRSPSSTAVSGGAADPKAASGTHAKTSVVRPWTAHTHRGDPSSTRVKRRRSQRLRGSHLQAARSSPRDTDADACVEDALDTCIEQLERETLQLARSSSTKHSVSETVSEANETRPDVRQFKNHHSFEHWVAGSPYDSDEYDTDLEEDEIDTKHPVERRVNIDAGGASAYLKQCQKHGLVPVSFLQRHLGKRAIKMRHHYLGKSEARPLAYALCRNTVTEVLDLSDNYLESAGATCIAAMLRENTFIVSMNLADNCIGSDGCAALADMLDVNTTLKTLVLAGNQLTDRDAHHFVDPLRSNMSLTFLDLSHNKLSEMAGLHLAAALVHNDGLNDLNLSWNSIRRKGAVALANALKINTVLEVLDLSWNGIGAEGTLAVMQALNVNTTLKVLDLTNNRIDTKSAGKLAQGLKNNSGLETLILNLNPMGDTGIGSILNAANLHPNLKFLSMENCGELGLNSETSEHINRLRREKGMVVLHGGSGGYHRNSFFDDFARQHTADIEAAFLQHDKDHCDELTAEEAKQCLKTAGLRLTTRQLDHIVQELEGSQSGKINYKDILSGRLISEHTH